MSRFRAAVPLDLQIYVARLESRFADHFGLHRIGNETLRVRRFVQRVELTHRWNLLARKRHFRSEHYAGHPLTAFAVLAHLARRAVGVTLNRESLPGGEVQEP